MNWCQLLSVPRFLPLFLSRALSLAVLAASFAPGSAHAANAPEFTHSAPDEWLNSAPLKLADLRGKVVMLDFWTFGCWNCYRSFPWQNGVRQQFGAQGLVVLSVHTPESDSERNKTDIAAKAQKFELANPVMIDDDASYWKAMGNRYWPTYYLIDKKGKVRAQFIGETHAGDKNALAMEAMVKKLLAEN